MGFNKRVYGFAQELRMSPQELLRRLYAKNVKILFKQGSYTTTAMQRSMRYRKKASKPGEPPSAHKKDKDHPRGPLLRDLCRYDVDQRELSVVSGPKKTTGVNPTVPQVLNQGGRVPVRLLKKVKFAVGKGGPIRRRADGSLAGVRLDTAEQVARADALALEENALRTKSVNPYIKPRPFTKPLLAKGGENFKNLARTVPL